MKKISDWDRIHEVTLEYSRSTSGVANIDTLVASIVFKLTEEGISRDLIDMYFRSDESALRDKWRPGLMKNGW